MKRKGCACFANVIKESKNTTDQNQRRKYNWTNSLLQINMYVCTKVNLLDWNFVVCLAGLLFCLILLYTSSIFQKFGEIISFVGWNVICLNNEVVIKSIFCYTQSITKTLHMYLGIPTINNDSDIYIC
jgi:hypothetical protein